MLKTPLRLPVLKLGVLETGLSEEADVLRRRVSDGRLDTLEGVVRDPGASAAERVVGWISA